MVKLQPFTSPLLLLLKQEFKLTHLINLRSLQVAFSVWFGDRTVGPPLHTLAC